MKDLITFGTPPLLIILRCTVIYVLLLLLALRLTGKRQLGQFTPFDFAVLLIVSNAVGYGRVGQVW
jgi:uncharacterized membrane protein YcaP (DUF421 family)